MSCQGEYISLIEIIQQIRNVRWEFPVIAPKLLPFTLHGNISRERVKSCLILRKIYACQEIGELFIFLAILCNMQCKTIQWQPKKRQRPPFSSFKYHDEIFFERWQLKIDL